MEKNSINNYFVVKSRVVISFLLLPLACWPASQEGVKKLSIKDVVNTLALASSQAQVEQLNFKNKMLEYENFKKSYLPSLAFNFSPFSFNHSLKLLQQPSDGSYTYVNDYSNNSSAGITLTQKIAVTGGSLTVGSNLNYLNEFSGKRHSFNTTPYTIGYSQQLWGSGKSSRMDIEIQNKTHEQDIKQYCAKVSDIQQQALGLFMSLFLAQLEMDLSLKNKNANDTLLQLAQLKLKTGDFTPYDYNQVEIQAANTKYAYENTLNSYQTAARNLFTFLGIDNQTNRLTLEAPVFDLPLSLDSALVMTYVNKNNPYSLSEKIKQLQAEKSLLSSRMSNKLNGNVNLSYGTNQYGNELPEAYQKLQSRQSVSVGLQIPVFQWGVNRNKLKMAENSYQVNLIEMEKERREFYNKIAEQVNSYNHSIKLWLIAEKTFALAREQYRLSLQKFQLGKISLYELFTAQQEQSSGLQKYYSAVRDAWSGYFSLRKTALYDFASGQELEEIFIKMK